MGQESIVSYPEGERNKNSVLPTINKKVTEPILMCVGGEEGDGEKKPNGSALAASTITPRKVSLPVLLTGGRPSSMP